ncbi:unnamed protein product [Microthlaspi erraticum]|uniref:FBD domain-containing protein n=1 Tax=Microthlaspi erraticum TaxID=1685480 RepID=A0A6D2HTZ0_9BRAS|nr:unnamed protein product [Microthlaspi erraticum]
MVPKLEFEFESTKKKFAMNVVTSLLSHEAPVLESLHLRVGDRCYNTEMGDIGVLAGIAFARHVREFVLVSSGAFVPFPSSLFYSASLETLKLENEIEVDATSPVSLKSLKTLHLVDVRYKYAESFHNLVSGCPNLEELLVHGDLYRHHIIVAPSLKRLSVYDSATGRKNARFVINAPCLKYLKISKLKGYEVCLIENACELVEADIRNVSEIDNEMILESLKSVKSLIMDLSPLEIKLPTGSIFNQLVYLEMYTHKAMWWSLLALMLDSSPKLNVLKLTDCGSPRENLHCSEKWSEPKCVPECLFSQLETFVWTSYDWRIEEEIQVATYILKNARRLKKEKFTPTKKLNELEQRREMGKEFHGVVMASNSCHHVFVFE